MKCGRCGREACICRTSDFEHYLRTSDAESFARFNSNEHAYQEHISNEGDGVANDHPDGCFYCGSGLHHSQDCPNKGVDGREWDEGDALSHEEWERES